MPIHNHLTNNYRRHLNPQALLRNETQTSGLQVCEPNHIECPYQNHAVHGRPDKMPSMYPWRVLLSVFYKLDRQYLPESGVHKAALLKHHSACRKKFGADSVYHLDPLH